MNSRRFRRLPDRRLRSAALVPCACIGLLAAPALAGGCLGDDRVVEDQVVLRLAPGASIAAVLADAQAQFPGLAALASIPAIRAWQVSVPEPLCELEVIDALEDDPRVLEITFNDVEESSEGQTQSFYFISIEGAFAAQPAWNVIGLPQAQQLGRGAGAVVAVIDSGIDATHPAFAGMRLLPGLSMLSGGAADVGDGVDNDGDGFTDESVGHGTHVAGVIGWMAPDASILPVRVLDSDGLTDVFTLSQGIAAAVTAGATVINVSIASPEASGILDEIVAFAIAGGATVVASAGNFDNEETQYPAALPGVLSVASTSIGDAKSAFSSYGETIDLCAPGDAIVGPIPGGAYAEWSGTSMASAIVAGAAALASSRAEKGPVAVAALASTAENLDLENPNLVGKLGHGRIDAGLAMASIVTPDINGDGTVDSADLARLLGAWGRCAACVEDLDRDGSVGAGDLSILLGAWG